MKEFNFFKPYLVVEKGTKKDSNFISVLSVVLGFLFVVALAGITTFYWVELSTLKKEVAALERVLDNETIKEQMEKLNELETEIGDIEREKLFMDGLELQFDNMSRVNGTFMDFLTHEVVDNLYLTYVEIKENEVFIEGISLNRMGIAQFEYDLRRNGDFENILIENIEKSRDAEGFEFRMSLRVKGGGVDEAQ